MLAIIQTIIAILSFIIGLFQPHQMGMRQAIYITDFHCAPVTWTSPAKVSWGEFTGTAETVCQFEGKGGGGIEALRAHMTAQLPLDADVSGLPQVEVYQGLPSMGFSTTLDLGEAKAAGTTHIASDGRTTLKNVFESRSVFGSSNARFVKAMNASMEVRTVDGQSRFELRATQNLRISKPLLMSGSEFKAALQEQAEESLLDRASDAAQEMARHL